MDDPTRQLSDVEQRLSSRALRTGLAMSSLSVEDLWSHCISLDDVPPISWLVAVLDNSQTRSAHQHDVVAQALNDAFADQGRDHPVRYTAQLTDGPSAT